MRAREALERLPEAIDAVIDISRISEDDVILARQADIASLLDKKQSELEPVATIIQISEIDYRARSYWEKLFLGCTAVDAIRTVADSSLSDRAGRWLTKDMMRDQVESHANSYRAIRPFLLRSQRRKIGRFLVPASDIQIASLPPHRNPWRIG